MNLVEQLEKVNSINIDTEVIEEKQTIGLLIYSIYYLYNEFYDFFNITDSPYDNIKTLIRTNMYAINEGADKIMTFYMINKYNFKSNSKFKETYELFLEQVKKNENALKEYANFNIYMTANEKFKKYEMGGNFS